MPPLHGGAGVPAGPDAAGSAPAAPDARGGSPWPSHDGRRVVFLIDASGRVERRLLEDWIEQTRSADVQPADYDVIPLPRARSGGRVTADPRLDACLAVDADAWMAPVRVAWLPEQRNGVRAARLADLVLGDPRDPGPLRQRRTLRRAPERCRTLAAEPATVPDLRARWARGGVTETTGLAEFVTRQAVLALERVERRLRGSRYKVPRLVREDIVARPVFQGTCARLAAQVGRTKEQVVREAAAYLKEIAASHSPFVMDLFAQFSRYMYAQGYDPEIRYDRAELERVLALTQRHAVVFLPTHKSIMDGFVMKAALHENGLPPNHTAGGINMNFFPFGPVIRRTGIFFIRRSFKDNPLYKAVLQQYIDYLVEKRFPLEWYIEGGRSRSGKLRPPRFGLLAYVVDAYRRGKCEDVHLIPVSIAYDQIREVTQYAAEQGGAVKQPESFAWLVRFARGLRAPHGRIYMRFGEPLALSEALGAPTPAAAPNPDARDLQLQKLAFEVCVRINQVTPITPTSLVTLALLGRGDQACTLPEIATELGSLVELVKCRGLPTVEDFELETAASVRGTVEALVRNGVIACYTAGPEPVYAIGRDQHLVAAYYRNTIIHFFINGALAQLALLRATEVHPEDRRAEFWAEVLRLRDLLKFEFFFPDKHVFRAEVERELALHDPDWEVRLCGTTEAVLGVLREMQPLVAHRVLRPFVEGYRVVGDALLRLGQHAAPTEAQFLADCLALGKQLRLQHRIQSPEAASTPLLTTGLRLARHRGLVEGPADVVPSGRRAFAQELRDTLRRIDAVQALDRERRGDPIPAD